MTIKELRIKLGLTQNECAAYLGVSRRTYQLLESNNVINAKYQFYLNKLNEYTPQAFNTNVVKGNDINILINNVKNYKKRYCYKHLLDYINNDYRGKICILYGLRRTGKTTLLFQLFGDVDIKKAAYIKIKDSDNMSMLIKDMNYLKNNGYKYVFIDEITLMTDFVNTAATLSDIYASLGMKIILSGTDSLGFVFADSDELYDRNVMIHTSYISFKEFSDILNINDIDTYIEYGGTFKLENMSFDDPDYKNDEVAFKNNESTRKYIDTAIARNIQRSLKNTKYGSMFSSLVDLFHNNELTNVINRIVDDMNHKFLLNVIEREYKSGDLGSSKDLLLHEKKETLQTALYDIDMSNVLKTMKNILDIKEKDELLSKVDGSAIEQIKEYLYLLDLIKPIYIKYDNGVTEERIIFTQPGMRYSITKSLVYSLLNDSYFLSLKEKDKEYIIQKILSDVKGRMLEDIVIYETSINQKAFKYRTIDNMEIDMVVVNKESINLYEIKHSKEISFDNQTKYLNDETLLNKIESRFGKINTKNVLYRGAPTTVNGINYINVEDYLKNIK